MSAAFDALADRRVFRLDDAQWAAFMAALDWPPGDNPRLRKLLAARTRWDPESERVDDRDLSIRAPLAVRP